MNKRCREIMDELILNGELEESTRTVFGQPMAKCGMEIMRTMKTKDEVYKIIL